MAKKIRKAKVKQKKNKNTFAIAVKKTKNYLLQQNLF